MLYFLLVVVVKNFCVVENGGCMGLCLLKLKGYLCLCLNGFYFVKIGNGMKC